MNDDPIAIIGFSLRFPEDADSAEAFWEMLYNGRCAMTEVPADRFTIDSFYAQKGEAGAANGTIPLRGGHFLKQDLAVFDAPFFNITPAEAEAMDPQHRLMLELSYHALENAGIPIAQCAGTKTSVYTASFTDDYKSILLDAPDNIPKYAATGLSMSMLANRVSWFYNFTGPSMNIDSACSSSLSALHIACQDLLSGTSEMALVGGANLIFHPDFMLIMSNMDFLSPSSKCHSFDHRANGYARGDGISVVILKRLSTALQDNDTIRAVIRATALNQDGRTPSGITQPSGDAQRTLIREMFERARLDMAPARFFEAHGTGTVIGDPTEARAIGEVFREYRSSESPLFVGAVKSNIGHLEGGSGLAGVIKTVMILERGVIVPNAGIERVNPRIDIEGLSVKFPMQPTIWPDYGLRRACVNSFGFGGSNAVVILDDALHYLQDRKMQGLHRTVDIAPQACIATKTAPTSSPAIPRLLVWSAADKTALSSLNSAYAVFLKTKTPILADSSVFLDMVYTVTQKRTLHSWRSYAVGTDSEDLSQSIDKANRVPAFAAAVPGSLAFIFTGQGAQYPRMGHGLLALPFLQNRLRELSSILHDIGCKWSLLELLEDAKAPINEPEYSQTYTSALQIATVDYFKDLNLHPAAVIGHSSGEIAAAYCTGAITDRTALTIAFHRGRLAQRLRSMHAATPQGMLAVAISEQAIQSYLDRLEDGTVQIGCVNSPKSITLTGSKAHLDLIEGWLVADGVFARRLRVDVAYHSRFVESIADDYLQALSGIPKELKQDGLVPMISTVTGSIIPVRTLCEPAYWVRNMVSQVKFSTAVRLLSRLARNHPRKQLGSAPQSLSGIRMFLEIGPHSTLQGPLQDILADDDGEATAPSLNHDYHERISYTNALNRKTHAGYSILTCAGYLWSRGYPTNLLKANSLSMDSPRAIRTDLPAYPFNHTRRHWFEDRLSSAFRFRRHAPHELLGVLSPDSNVFESRWRNILSLERVPWLEDHRISGAIVFPAAAILAMVIEAARQLQDNTIPSFEFRAVHFLNALQIPVDKAVETSVVLSTTTKASRKETDSEKAWYTFRIFSYVQEECMEHSRGTIGTWIGEDKGNHQIEQTISQALECRLLKKTDIKALYSAIRTNGVSYGPIFQVLDNLRLDYNGAAVSEIRPCPDREQIKTKLVNYEIYPLHPSTLDGLFQMVFAALSDGESRYPAAMVPSYLGKMTIFNNTSTGCALCPEKGHKSFLAYNKSALLGYRGTESTVVALCPRSKRVVGAMEGYQTTFVSSSSSASPGDSALDQTQQLQLLSNLIWRPDLSLLTRGQLERIFEAARDGDDVADDVDWQLNLLIRYYIGVALQKRAVDVGAASALSDRAAEMLQSSLANLEKMDIEMPANIRDEQKFIQESHSARLALEERLSTASSAARFYLTLGQRALHRLELNLQIKSQPFEPDPKRKALVEDQDLVEALLQEHLNSQHLIKPLGLLLDLLVHKNPLLKIMQAGWIGDSDPNRYARMLCGSANGYCPWLRYDYVEFSKEGPVQVAPGFAGDFERVNEGPLDTGRDRYDLVIVPLFLYTTPTPGEALGQIRAFLKPGGYLILHGVMLLSSPRTRFAASLAPEWWLGLGNSPYCTETELNAMLVRTGFSGIDAVIPDRLNPGFRETNIVISKTLAGVEETENSLSSKNQGIVIVTDDKTFPQQTFAHRLESAIKREPSMNVQICISTFSKAITTSMLQGKFCLSLLEYTRPFFTTLTPAEFELFKQALSMADGFLWVSGGVKDPRQPEFHLVDGLARALRSENSLLRLVRLTVADMDCEAHVLTVLKEAMTATSLDNMEFEYEERDGVLQISRVVQFRHMNQIIGDKIANRQHKVSITLDQDATLLQIRIPKPGEGPLLHTSDDTLLEEALNSTKPLRADEILIRVHALGLSHHDYLIASGKINSTELVSACAGFIHEAGVSSGFTVGERVLVSHPAAGRTLLKCPASSAVLLPPHVSFETAAGTLAEGLPVLYALYYMARVEEGDTVLVRSADGDTNGAAHAAVLAAKYLGANVVIASGDGDRDGNYSEVDVVLNYNSSSSSSSSSVDASLDALAPGGILINMSAGIAIPQHCLEIAAWKPITLATMDLTQIPRQRPARIQKLLSLFVSIYLQQQGHNGSITTDSTQADRVRVYQASELSTALEFLKGEHVSGPVAVDVSPGQTVSALVAPRPFPDFDPNATYVIAGGFGGLGRSICRSMVSRGARHLLILSRSGTRNELARELVKELSALGARVHAPVCDISKTEALQKVLVECNILGMPRIRGCIQCTMVLRDAIFTNMTHNHFTTSTAPKVLGSWNLHALLPRDLDFFILLSSVGGILGAPSQANYCAGNTYMDALARYRTFLGEGAVSIDLGMMVSAGVVAETEGMLNSLQRMGWFMDVGERELFALLEVYCHSGLESADASDGDSHSDSQIVVGIETPAGMARKGLEPPHWMQRPFFSHFHLLTSNNNDKNSPDSHQSAQNPSNPNISDIKTLLNQTPSPSPSTAATHISNFFIAKLSQITGIPREAIDPAKPIHAADGINSLVAVELRNWFEKKVGADVGVLEILGGGSITELCMLAAGRTRFRGGC